jgi:hypothetical protein
MSYPARGAPRAARSDLAVRARYRPAARVRSHHGVWTTRGSASTRAQQFGVHPQQLLPCPAFEKNRSRRGIGQGSACIPTVQPYYRRARGRCQSHGWACFTEVQTAKGSRLPGSGNGLRAHAVGARPPRRLAPTQCGAFDRPDQARQSAEPILREPRSGFAPPEWDKLRVDDRANRACRRYLCGSGFGSTGPT